MPHHHHPKGHGHPHDERGHADGERDWADFGAHLELEAEVTMPLLRQAVDAITHAAGSIEEVRTTLDLGSGPGVATVALAERFSLAAVTAVDASEPLLDLVSARARRFGVDGRVEIRVADLEQPLGDLADAGSVDLVWASMVLHHVLDLPRALTDVHRLLRPGGVLAVVELGGLHGTLPAGFNVGRVGFVERLTKAVRVSLEEHLPPGAMSIDWPAVLADAGFDVIDQRDLTMHLPAPLDDAPRRLVLQELPTSARRVAGLLDADDRDLLAALVDVSDPRCILHRDDLSFSASRILVIARRR